MVLKLDDTRTSIVGNKIKEFNSPLIKSQLDELVKKFNKQKIKWKVAVNVRANNNEFVCTSNQLDNSCTIPVVLREMRDSDEIVLLLNLSVKTIPTGLYFDSWESCYSQKKIDLYYRMKRSFLISYSYDTVEGKTIRGLAMGAKARLLQHEYDHLCGIQVNFNSKSLPKTRAEIGR